MCVQRKGCRPRCPVRNDTADPRWILEALRHNDNKQRIRKIPFCTAQALPFAHRNRQNHVYMFVHDMDLLDCHASGPALGILNLSHLGNSHATSLSAGEWRPCWMSRPVSSLLLPDYTYKHSSKLRCANGAKPAREPRAIHPSMPNVVSTPRSSTRSIVL